VPPTLQSLKIIGLHPFSADEALIQEAREDFWGGWMTPEREAHVQSFFKDLYLVEIEAIPLGASIDWSGITQPRTDLAREDWQVPYLERQIDDTRWAFFFHYLDVSKPLASELGDLTLPETTTLIPPRLENIEYWLP